MYYEDNVNMFLFLLFTRILSMNIFVHVAENVHFAVRSVIRPSIDRVIS